jgi:hypothetical protein
MVGGGIVAGVEWCGRWLWVVEGGGKEGEQTFPKLEPRRNVNWFSVDRGTRCTGHSYNTH